MPTYYGGLGFNAPDPTTINAGTTGSALGAVGSGVNQTIQDTTHSVVPGIVGAPYWGIDSLYHTVNNLINPKKPNLTDPSAAGAPPNQQQIEDHQLAQTQQNVFQMSRSNSLLPYTESLDSGSTGNGPMTTSRVLLGS